MADRFFTPDPLAPGDCTLNGPEAHHMAAVRRFGPGDQVTLFNGDGCEYPAEVISIGKKSAVLHISARIAASRELGFPLVVASALPKGDRADFLIEKLTELGVTRFIPLVAERSVVRPRESTVEKFTRAVIEASKQCGRNTLMVVEPPREWTALLSRADLPETRLVLHTGPDLPHVPGSPSGCAVAIGPEGGFTPAEIEAAIGSNWKPVSLGPRTLRMETAALAAAALLGHSGL
jgi:16S rRNA (uracil1498-N3)-methyltransferase